MKSGLCVVDVVVGCVSSVVLWGRLCVKDVSCGVECYVLLVCVVVGLLMGMLYGVEFGVWNGDVDVGLLVGSVCF